MKIFNSIVEFSSQSKAIVTLGTFDGVHIGHKKIIRRLTKSAKESGCESLVLTFFPHPRMILQQNTEIKLLTTIEERSFLLQDILLDNLIIHPFDEKFSQLTAEEFVKNILVDQFNIQRIIIGHDHKFGKNRSADIHDLIAFGRLYDFDVEQISAQEIDEVYVSSTKIRKALTEGNIALANDYLGYNYLLTGTVVRGKQLGRTINFPTANIKIKENDKLIPQNGVYIVKSVVNNKMVYGMMNIGMKPTVNGKEQTIEVHFLDFNSDIYHQELQISFLSRIRSEQKFDSIALLQEQLEKDKNTTLDYIRNF